MRYWIKVHFSKRTTMLYKKGKRSIKGSIMSCWRWRRIFLENLISWCKWTKGCLIRSRLGIKSLSINSKGRGNRFNHQRSLNRLSLMVSLNRRGGIGSRRFRKRSLGTIRCRWMLSILWPTVQRDRLLSVKTRAILDPHVPVHVVLNQAADRLLAQQQTNKSLPQQQPWKTMPQTPKPPPPPTSHQNPSPTL